jgi:hypothetical protein
MTRFYPSKKSKGPEARREREAVRAAQPIDLLKMIRRGDMRIMDDASSHAGGIIQTAEEEIYEIYI